MEPVKAGGGTSVETNLRKVDALIEAFNAHDVDRALDFRSESVIHRGPGLRDPLEGHEALHAFTHGLIHAFPDVRFEKERAFGQGEWVVLMGTVRGAHEGPIEGPSGNEIPIAKTPVRYRDCIVFKFEGGKVVEEREYYDQLDLLTQLRPAGD